MKNEVYTGRLEGLEIAFTHAVTTGAVNEVVVLHDCDPAAAHLLGRSVTAVVMAAALLPEGQRLNVSWRYPGALTSMVVDAGQDGSVRGMVSPVHLGDVAEDNQSLYGEVGELQVVTTRERTVLNSGTTPVSLHDPVADFGYHFSISDQVETGLVSMIGFQRQVEAPVALAQGWMVQALPGCDLERFERVRRRMEGETFRRLLQEPGAADDGFGRVVEVLTEGESGYAGLEVTAGPSPRFACTCSMEKMAAVVRSIPIPERMSMVKRDEDVSIRCHFCSTKYTLTIADCVAAWNDRSGA